MSKHEDTSNAGVLHGEMKNSRTNLFLLISQMISIRKTTIKRGAGGIRDQEHIRLLKVL